MPMEPAKEPATKLVAPTSTKCNFVSAAAAIDRGAAVERNEVGGETLENDDVVEVVRKKNTRTRKREDGMDEIRSNGTSTIVKIQ